MMAFSLCWKTPGEAKPPNSLQLKTEPPLAKISERQRQADALRCFDNQPNRCHFLVDFIHVGESRLVCGFHQFIEQGCQTRKSRGWIEVSIGSCVGDLFHHELSQHLLL